MLLRPSCDVDVLVLSGLWFLNGSSEGRIQGMLIRTRLLLGGWMVSLINRKKREEAQQPTLQAGHQSGSLVWRSFISAITPSLLPETAKAEREQGRTLRKCTHSWRDSRSSGRVTASTSRHDVSITHPQRRGGGNIFGFIKIGTLVRRLSLCVSLHAHTTPSTPLRHLHQL